MIEIEELKQLCEKIILKLQEIYSGILQKKHVG